MHEPNSDLCVCSVAFSMARRTRSKTARLRSPGSDSLSNCSRTAWTSAPRGETSRDAQPPQVQGSALTPSGLTVRFEATSQLQHIHDVFVDCSSNPHRVSLSLRLQRDRGGATTSNLPTFTCNLTQMSVSVFCGCCHSQQETLMYAAVSWVHMVSLLLM